MLRMGACAWSIFTGSLTPLALGFLIAEFLGIIEELVDER